jgi:hypothetical protein
MGERAPLDRFVRAFVLPMVAGGPVHVRGLVGPGMLDQLTATTKMDATLLLDVVKHVRAHLAHLGPVGAIDILPRDAVALAAVWYNLIAMTHPEVVGRARLRRKVRAWCAQMLEWVGVPRTAHEVSLRHGLLARLGEVGRVDTDVSFWAGSAKFVGVAPPSRLMVWKTVRRVRETKVRVGLFDLLAELRSEQPDLDLLEPARVALSLSPLTDVALADRPTSMGAFQWTNASVNALADNALRGASARLILSDTASTGDRGAKDATPPRVRAIEQGTRDAVALGLPPAAAQILVAFHLELLVTDALGRGAPPAGHPLAWDALARLGPERAARVVGLNFEPFEHALRLDTKSREPLRDAPALPVLERAGFLEVST